MRILCLFLAWALVSVLGQPARAAQPAPGPGAFTLPAWAFDRGNAKTFTNKTEYADAGPMIAFGGHSPVLVEYDFDLPATGSYRFTIDYAAAQARPVNVLIDGKYIGQGCVAATGSWNTSGARPDASSHCFISEGRHTLRLQRPGDFPHIVSIRVESAAIPPGWAPKRPGARTLQSPPPAPLFAPWIPEVEVAALRRAIQDLSGTFDARYAQGPEFLKQLDALEKRLAIPAQAADAQSELVRLQRLALLKSNPLLDFERILLVRREGRTSDLGLPYNWESNSSLSKRGYHDALCVMSLRPDEPEVKALFRPPTDVFLGDVDLHFDAKRLLYSSVDAAGRWQVFEMPVQTPPGGGDPVCGAPRALTGSQPDVDSYDACYLANDDILFTCTAPFTGVPCVYGASHVANLYRMRPDGSQIRQLCFDQEHNWCPTLLNNGRVLYTRWEYADTPHSNTRLLFHMNPDGTEQMEYVGSGSYWPNSFFYARPIPGHPTRVIAVVGGHHDHPRMGELVLFDPAQGRHESAPVVQRIPGFGKKVEPIIRDGLTLNSWPKFLHPFPLSDKYFLVSCKPAPDAPWGIYLADVFDNLIPIKQLADGVLFEPLPFRPVARPPVIPDKVDLSLTNATIVIQDIYQGEGMRGVPRGTIKSLRVFTYHFAYQGMGGLLGIIGADGPWDIKRVVGTVPVAPDGSAVFTAPANTPLSVQPLDAGGRAVQLMRSWMTAMPGEVLQCTGCHERQNTAPASRPATALRRAPDAITPWRGPVRGFSYAREVQPVIDRYCVSCHDGKPHDGRPALADLGGDRRAPKWSSVAPGNGGDRAGRFSAGYAELHRYVRRPGIESDYHVLTPMEFHAGTTHLVQMLQKGHHGVQLDAEAWDRLITWIDLNCPYHGTWGEEIDKPGRQRERRRDLLKLYANVQDDPEAVDPVTAFEDVPMPPAPVEAAPAPDDPAPAGWPFDAAEARRRQTAAGPATRRFIDLGAGIRIEMALIPPGEFLTGGGQDGPLRRARVAKAFWMSTLEIANRAYQRFDSGHDSRVEDKNAYQFGIHGYPANQPGQPVVRVSWNEASAFCRWLSERTGESFALPTEAQWEFACRAGAASPFAYGGFDTNFGPHANFADATISGFASDPYTVDVPLKNPTAWDDWIPKDARFKDGALLAVEPGRYQPNAWGLCDMHGNAAEWTQGDYTPDAGAPRKAVRGGSWRDVPRHGTASYRAGYAPWQRVFNVGFRVISEGPARGPELGGSPRP